MPADNDLDPVDRWLSQPVWPMSPPDGAFERVTKRARRRRVRKTVAAVASAAAVVAAIAVAVPLGLSSGLGSSPAGNNLAAGASSTSSHAASRSAQSTATHPATTMRPRSAAFCCKRDIALRFADTYVATMEQPKRIAASRIGCFPLSS